MFSIAGVGQKNFNPVDFQKSKWLQGSWKGMSAKEPFYEAWRLVNDSTLANLAIEIKCNDTLIKESGALMLRNRKITLGQQPVMWETSRFNANELVLKNDTLRFSNVITWLHTKDDHWFTILEHPKSTVYYDMTRDASLDRKVDAWLL